MVRSAVSIIEDRIWDATMARPTNADTYTLRRDRVGRRLWTLRKQFGALHVLRLLERAAEKR
mgnify:FL=1